MKKSMWILFLDISVSVHLQRYHPTVSISFLLHNNCLWWNNYFYDETRDVVTMEVTNDTNLDVNWNGMSEHYD